MDATEAWRDIPGYEGSYQVSSLGRLRSLTRMVELNNEWAKERRQYGKVLKPASGGVAGENLKVRKSGQRTCVTCTRIKSRENYRRKRAA